MPLPGVHSSHEVGVIVNAAAGLGNQRQVWQQLEKVFSGLDGSARLVMAEPGEDLVKLAHQAVAAGCKTVVAAGGDGTVRAVASALVGTNVALGVIPSGSLNHFAKDLRIPLDIAAAARNITNGRIVAVDVGEVNGKLFVNNSSIGLYPRLVLLRQQQQRKGRRKLAASIVAGFHVLRRYPFVRVRVVADGRHLAGKSPFVFVGNNAYQLEGFKIGARESLDRGTLGLYMAKNRTRLGLLNLVFRALTRRLRRAAGDFFSMSVHEIRIETRHSHLLVATDGEIERLATPLHYRILPGALRVVAPAE